MNRTTAPLAALILISASTVRAAHPLVTDDPGTQGRGGLQIEFNSQFDRNEGEGVVEHFAEHALTLSYGALESIDIVAGLPLQYLYTVSPDGTVFARGFSDLSLELKWRFLSRGGFEFALKPGFTFPTGSKAAGMTAVLPTQSAFLIGSRAFGATAVHANLGYLRNNNDAGDRLGLWHASLASETAVAKGLRLTANVGAERNPDPAAGAGPAFALLGLVYSAAESLDLDLGYKRGLTDAEPGHALLAGTAFRF